MSGSVSTSSSYPDRHKHVATTSVPKRWDFHKVELEAFNSHRRKARKSNYRQETQHARILWRTKPTSGVSHPFAHNLPPHGPREETRCLDGTRAIQANLVATGPLPAPSVLIRDRFNKSRRSYPVDQRADWKRLMTENGPDHSFSQKELSHPE